MKKNNWIEQTSKKVKQKQQHWLPQQLFFVVEEQKNVVFYRKACSEFVCLFFVAIIIKKKVTTFLLSFFSVWTIVLKVSWPQKKKCNDSLKVLFWREYKKKHFVFFLPATTDKQQALFFSPQKKETFFCFSRSCFVNLVWIQQSFSGFRAKLRSKDKSTKKKVFQVGKKDNQRFSFFKGHIMRMLKQKNKPYWRTSTIICIL